MARKKEKSGFLSAFGTVLEIWKKIVDAVLSLGGNDEDLRRLLTDRTLAKKVAEVIMASKQKVQETYKVLVDCTMSLTEMIKACNCDYNNPDINDQNFPIQGTGKQEVDFVLVIVRDVLEWLKKEGQAVKDQNWVTTKQVLAFMVSQGLLPAWIWYLLAFGTTNPELQRQFPIVALGSSFVLVDGFRVCPCLDSDDDERRLSLRWGGDGIPWLETCRFLAFRK